MFLAPFTSTLNRDRTLYPLSGGVRRGDAFLSAKTADVLPSAKGLAELGEVISAPRKPTPETLPGLATTRARLSNIHGEEKRIVPRASFTREGTAGGGQ